MNNRANQAGTGRSLSRFYFVVWLALGAAGIFYVTLASLAPDALRGADAGQGTAAIDVTNKQVAALSTTVNAIKTSVDSTQTKQQALASGLESLRNDVTGIKVKLTDLSAVGQDTATGVSGLDGKSAPAATAKGQGQNVAAKSNSTTMPTIDGEVIPPDPTLVSGPSSEAAMDGADDTVPTVPAKSAKAAKATKLASAGSDAKDAKKDPAAGKPFAINLAVSQSPDALRAMWQLFKDQHADLLSGLSPRSSPSGNNLRLLAGPFASQAAANSQCAKLRKEGMFCEATPMAGVPL